MNEGSIPKMSMFKRKSFWVLMLIAAILGIVAALLFPPIKSRDFKLRGNLISN